MAPFFSSFKTAVIVQDPETEIKGTSVISYFMIHTYLTKVKVWIKKAIAAMILEKMF